METERMPVAVSPEDAEAAILEDELVAERKLLHTMVVSVIVTVPAMILVWVGVVALALAVGGDSPGSWWPWIGLGVGIGVLSGTFFGCWAGIVSSAPRLDEIDHHVDEISRGLRHA